MVQRDYLLRMIEQFAATIARIVARRKEGELDQAEVAIDEAYASLGLPRAMLDALDASSLATVLGAPEKLEFAARLLEEEAALAEARGKPHRASERRARARALGEAATRAR